MEKKSNLNETDKIVVDEDRDINSYLTFFQINQDESWSCGLIENDLIKMIEESDTVHFLKFRKEVLSTVEGVKLMNSLTETLRPDSVRRLWEIEVKQKISEREENSRVSTLTSRNAEKMLDEFELRQSLKEKNMYYGNFDKNALEYFQLIEIMSPYLSSFTLEQINHAMSTQLNESLNKAMTAMASKDRFYNGSCSLRCRQSVVILRRNEGYGKYLLELTNKLGFEVHSGIQWLCDITERKRNAKRERALESTSKMLRSSKKRLQRSALTKKEEKDAQKGLSYAGDGKEMMTAVTSKEPVRRCKWCNESDHVTRGSSKCFYN